MFRSLLHPEIDYPLLTEGEVFVNEANVLLLSFVSENVQHLYQDCSLGLSHLGLLLCFRRFWFSMFRLLFWKGFFFLSKRFLLSSWFFLGRTFLGLGSLVEVESSSTPTALSLVFSLLNAKFIEFIHHLPLIEVDIFFNKLLKLFRSLSEETR